MVITALEKNTGGWGGGGGCSFRKVGIKKSFTEVTFEQMLKGEKEWAMWTSREECSQQREQLVQKA